MKRHKIIVIGASAGGVEALSQLFRGLKPDLNAAIFVVLHIPASTDSLLPHILNRQSRVPVEAAEDGKIIQTDHAYIAPPDQHLVIQDGIMRLTFGPKVNHTRPAIDPLFESAARQYGPDVIGVVLSGLLYDGTKGLLTIKQSGGVSMVQDPDEALFTAMPASAIKFVQVDYTLPVAKIAALLNRLTDQTVLEKGETQVKEPIPDFSKDEINLIKREIKSYEEGRASNQRSVLTCPDCGGVLWELNDGQLVRYRCHTGHIYNAEGLLTSYDKDYEKAFWTALRILIEKAAISNRLAINAMEHGDEEREAYFLSIAKAAEDEAERVRKTWFDGKTNSSRHESAGEQVNDEVTRSTE